MSPVDDAERQAANTSVRVPLEHAEAAVGPGAIARILRREGEDRPVEVLLDATSGELLRHAGLALYQAEAAGRNHAVIHHHETPAGEPPLLELKAAP